MRLAKVRFRPTISLRVMILLVVASAGWLGWVTNRAKVQRKTAAEIGKYNGYVRYDYEMVDGDVIPDAEPRAPAWLRRIVGDENFRRVVLVAYVDQPISDATLAPLGDLGGIEDFMVLSRRGYHSLPEVAPPPGLDHLTESGLARLESLTHLRRIKIEHHHLNGSMLNRLRRSPRLESIHLIDVEMTDAGMPPLGAMPRLRKLDLWSNQLTGDFLGPIRGSTTLEELELRNNPLTDAGLRNIGTLANLRSLDLSRTEVGDSGLAHLRGLTRLSSLALEATRATDGGLAVLEGMTQLEVLNLGECRITGRGLAHLKGLTRLKSLVLGGCPVDDSGLAALNGLTQLETLQLYRTGVTDAGLDHLRGLRKLREWSLIATRVTDAGVARLRQALPSLVAVGHSPPNDESNR